MQTNVFHLQDCIEGMMSLPEKSIDTVVTSPPYNLNIKYSKYKDMKPRDQYLSWLHDVFVGVDHCLKDDGHFFLNVGYSNIDPWVGMDVANVARDIFVLQNNIAWVKSIHIKTIRATKKQLHNTTFGHFKPISSKRFTCPTWEHLFHFTKSGNVEIDRLAVGVKYEYYQENIRGEEDKPKSNPKDSVLYEEDIEVEGGKSNLRDKGNSWFMPYETINTKDLRGNHPATFPEKLVEDCLKLTGIQNGVVLDPFMGTGTTAVAAAKNDWDFIGYDIDEEYVDFSKKRLEKELDNPLNI